MPSVDAPTFMPKTKRRNKKLAFNLNKDSSSSEGFDSDDEPERSTPKGNPQRSGSESGDSALKSPSRSSTDNEKSIAPPSPTPKGKSSRKPTSHPDKSFESGSSSLPPKDKTKGKETFIALSDDEDEDAVVLPTPRRSQGNSKAGPSIVLDDSEDSLAPVSTQSARKVQEALDEESSDDDDLPKVHDIHSSATRKFSLVSSSMKRKRNSSPDESSDDVISSPAKKRHRSVQQSEDTDSESATSMTENVPASNSRSSRKKSRVDDDNEDSEAGQRKRLTRRQAVKKPHRTPKQKQMELLRRKRAGENIDQVTDSSSDDDVRGRGIYDSGSDIEALSQFDDESEDEAIEEVRMSLRPGVNNEYDDSFVVEDEELGVPSYGVHDIPLEFTHHAHKRMKDHFKDAVEWMVQNKINPAFNRNDAIYHHAFRKLNDEAQGMAMSKYSSSAWKEDFTKTLWARPMFLESDISVGDPNEGQKCDACGRSRHPAKHILQFAGNPYDFSTLEDLDNSGDEEDGEVVERNSKGQVIPSADKLWYVGR
jgi:hypothetical protein